MKVLHVTPYFAPAFCYGGPPRSILGLCRSMRSQVDVTVFTTVANGETDLPVGRRAVESIPTAYFPLSVPRRVFRSAALVRAVEKEARSFDIVHVHGLWNATSVGTMAAAARLRVPFVVSPRGMLQARAMSSRSTALKKLVFELRDRRRIGKAAILHATSEVEADELRKHFPAARIALIPNGVDFPPEPIDTRVGGSKTVLYLGRLHRLKRIDLLLDAFEIVAQRDEGAELLIAGRDEDGIRARLASRSARLGDRVRWLGEVGYAEKFELLRAAGVLVHCSDTESFGVSIAEALAVGTPAVVTRTCPWFGLESDGGGYWVDQTAAAIADGILKAIADPQANLALGRKGAEWVRRTYGWDSIGSAMVRQYESVL